MDRRMPQRPDAGSSFAWSGVMCSAIMAAIASGLYALHDHHVLSEEQILLLLFMAIPIAAFILSGAGQDRSPNDEESRKG